MLARSPVQMAFHCGNKTMPFQKGRGKVVRDPAGVFNGGVDVCDEIGDSRYEALGMQLGIRKTW